MVYIAGRGDFRSGALLQRLGDFQVKGAVVLPHLEPIPWHDLC